MSRIIQSSWLQLKFWVLGQSDQDQIFVLHQFSSDNKDLILPVIRLGTE